MPDTDADGEVKLGSCWGAGKKKGGMEMKVEWKWKKMLWEVEGGWYSEKEREEEEDRGYELES